MCMTQSGRFVCDAHYTCVVRCALCVCCARVWWIVLTACYGHSIDSLLYDFLPAPSLPPPDPMGRPVSVVVNLEAIAAVSR